MGRCTARLINEHPAEGQIIQSVWLNPRALAIFQYAISEFCIHLSEKDRLAIADWTERASKATESFPRIDPQKAFLKRKQIGNYIRGIRYFMACGVNPLISYAIECLRHRGNAMANVWGSAYVLETGDYNLAYRFKVGYPVKNVTIAFPMHEKVYNLVMWGDDRAIETRVNNYGWLELRTAHAFPWLTKGLPNKKPTEFKDDSDWRDIHFLKFTAEDFRRTLSSVILDDYVMSPQEMLYTFGVLSGRVSFLKSDTKNSVYRVNLSDISGSIGVNIGFAGCKFPVELSVGDHVACLCNAFIFSSVPYAIQSFLVEESTVRRNSAIAFIRFRRKVLIEEFVGFLGREILDDLMREGFVELRGDVVEYVPRAFVPGEGYSKPDRKSGILRLKTVHRFANELYDMKLSTNEIYKPVTAILSPLPEYLHVAGDLFYFYKFRRMFWKEIFGFAKANEVDLSKPLPCPTCPVQLNRLALSADASTGGAREKAMCIVYAISKRLISEKNEKDFSFKDFQTFVKAKDPEAKVEFDQGDMIVRKFIGIVRISPKGDIIAVDGPVTETKFEDLIQEFESGIRCPYVYVETEESQ